MKMIDLTIVANKIFKPEMKVDGMLIKAGLEIHRLKVLEMNEILNKVLRVYDNPIEVKAVVTKLLADNNNDLRKRGLVEAKKLELEEAPLPTQLRLI